MIRALVSTSIKFRFLVISLAAALMALSWTQLSQASLEALPEFSPTYVEIQTEALGLSAEEVEQMVTVPLEADLLNGVQDVDVIRSESLVGLSRIVMVFKPGIDDYVARSRVQEKLTQAHALPQVSRPPTMLQPLSSESRLLMFSLEPEQISAIEASVIARWTVRPRLMGVPGVANVAVWGQRERQLQVQVDPEVLRQNGVTLDDIVETTGNAQIVSPLTFLEASTPGTGGFIETAQQRLQIRHVFDKLATPAQLGKVPVVETKLRLQDVATIVEQHQPLIGDAVVGDRGQGLLLVVEKFPGADTREVTGAVQAALEELKPGLSGMTVNTTLFRAIDYLDEAAGHLGIAGALALVGLALGLAFTLLNWRAVVVAALTVVASVSLAALAVHQLGQTFNLLTLAGLAVAVVFMVDDAISGNAAALSAAGTGGQDAARVPEALGRSRATLGYATVAGILTIAPAAVLQGRPGAFLQPMVVAYAAGVVTSLVTALVLAPALTSLLLTRAGATPGWRQRVVSGHARLGERFSGRSGASLAVLLVIALASGAGIAVAGWSIVPTVQDRNVLVTLEGPAGASLPAMTQITGQVSAQLRALEGVESAAAHVGRAITGDVIADVNTSELWVRIARSADFDRTFSAIARAVTAISGVTSHVSTYSAERIATIGRLLQGSTAEGNRLDVLTGSAHPLVVRVYGENDEAMAAKAQEIASALGKVSGLSDITVNLPARQDSIQITVDLDKARAHGLKPGDVRRSEAVLVQGIQVGSIFEGQKVFDVVVLGTSSTRASVESVKNLLIDTAEDKHVRLGEVADVQLASVPIAIERDAVARKIDVVANVSGRSIADAAVAAKEAIKPISFPLEHHAEVLTSVASDEYGGARVLGIGLGAVAGVFLLLQAALRSWRLGFVAFAASSASISGAVAVALVTGSPLGGLIGILAILGLAVRHVLAIYRGAQDLEDEPDVATERAIADATSGRFWAALGSLVTITLVALPFAFGGGAGTEILHPMALTLLGGVVTTALVGLVLAPLAYPWSRPQGAATATGGAVS